MSFNIINEKNVFKLGNIISVFTLPNIEKEIVLFSIEDYEYNEDDENELHVAYLCKDSEGYDYIEEIKDEMVLKCAIEAVKDMIGVINNG